MQINNCNSALNFGRIRLYDGGIEHLENEGVHSLRIFNEERNFCENLCWQLDINSGGYQLTNPQNKQTYSGPFSVKKHFGKGKFSVLMKNINNNTVSFSIRLKKEEISFWYKNIKNATGIDKMIKILKVLELKK